MTIKDVCLIFLAAVQTVIVLLISVFYYLIALARCFIPRVWKRHSVKGKITLITGGGSGIGRSVAQRLAKKGSVIVLWDINASGNEETAKLIRNAGGTCYAYTVDLCDRACVYKCAEKVKKEVGKVDILVNNAGIVSGGSFLTLKDEMILKTFEVNTLSHFWTTKAFLSDMKQDNSGQLVTVASVAGLFGANRLVDYTASKFANMGFHEAMALELHLDGYTGITSTVICPYYINTGMFDGVKSRILPILDQDYVADEIADAILMKEAQLVLPKFLNVLVALKGILSYKTIIQLGHAVQVNRTMDTFTGRKKVE